MRSKTRKILLPVLALLIGAAGAVAIVRAKPETPRVRPPEIVPLVETTTARAVDHRFVVEAQGTVEARTSSALVAEVAGSVVRVRDDFVSGGFFEAGETLVWLDDRDYRAALAQAEAQVAQAALALEREREEARVAREEWERFDREGEPSPLVLREPQLAQARAARVAAEAQRDRARRDLDRTQVRAPYAGRIRTTNVDVGDFVQPGAPAAAIYAVDYAEIRLPLFDEDLAFLDLPIGRRGVDFDGSGPRAVVRGRFAGVDHQWEGTVHRTEGEIDPRTRLVHVVVRVPDPYGEATAGGVPLVVGMYVDVAIQGRTAENVVVLPRRTLLTGGQLGVVIDGTLHLRTPEILRATENRIVVADGVADGEEVLLTRLDTMVEGMDVRVAGADDEETAR